MVHYDKTTAGDAQNQYRVCDHGFVKLGFVEFLVEWSLENHLPVPSVHAAQ